MSLKFLTKAKKIFKKTEDNQVYDLAVVCSEKNQGWILDAVSRKLLNNYQGKTIHIDSNSFKGKLPKAKIYFYSHYFFYLKFFYGYYGIQENFSKGKNIVIYTHPRDTKPINGVQINQENIIKAFNQAYKISFMNQTTRNEFVSNGLNSDIAKAIQFGADPKEFYPLKNTKSNEVKTIGLVCAYHERKNPQLIFEIIKKLQNFNFILVGRHWERHEGFNQLLKLSNFKYITPKYQDYLSYYHQMDVYLMPSELEGGPVPLIEAMLCNIPPVASKTGYAPDLIRDKENGFLFDINNVNVEDIENLINQALKLDNSKIRETVLEYSWDNFIKKVLL